MVSPSLTSSDRAVSVTLVPRTARTYVQLRGETRIQAVAICAKWYHLAVCPWSTSKHLSTDMPARNDEQNSATWRRNSALELARGIAQFVDELLDCRAIDPIASLRCPSGRCRTMLHCCTKRRGNQSCRFMARDSAVPSPTACANASYSNNSDHIVQSAHVVDRDVFTEFTLA